MIGGFALKHDGTWHFHRVVVGVATDETQDIDGGGFPDFFKSLPCKRIQAAEWLIEQKDVPAVGFNGKFRHDQIRLAAVPGGKATVRLLGIQLDALGEIQRGGNLILVEEHFENHRRSDFRIETQILGQILDEALGAEISGDGLERLGKGAEQRGFTTTVTSEQEVSATGQGHTLPEAGEGAAVADLKTWVEMDGWG